MFGVSSRLRSIYLIFSFCFSNIFALKTHLGMKFGANFFKAPSNIRISDLNSISIYSNILSASTYLLAFPTCTLASTDGSIIGLDVARTTIDIFVNGLSLLFIFRTVLSWYPKTDLKIAPYSFIAWPTEPLLQPVRDLIPPAFGVDISSIVWIMILSFLREILTGQQELERLANTVGVDFNISEDSGESEYLYFMETLVSKFESSREQIVELQEKIQQKDEVPEKKSYSTNLSSKERKLLKQTAAFEQQVNVEIEKADEGMGYAEKLNRLNQKFQKEKDQRKVLESFIHAQNKKIKVLINHVEKLMKAIKIESNKRIHLVEENRRMSNEQGMILSKTDKQQKINTLQHRTIQELREGSKVLEDQLRLMDEKYLELKSKFDLAREQFHRKYKKLSKENDDMKVHIRVNMGIRASMGATASSHKNPSPPASPLQHEYMYVTVPSTAHNTMASNNNPFSSGTSSPHPVAVGSGMNPVLSRKAAATAAASANGLVEKPSTNNKIETMSAPAMSSSFLLSKQSFSSPADAGIIQMMQDGGGNGDNGQFRPMSALSPMNRVGEYSFDTKNRPQSAAGSLSSSSYKKKNNKALNHVMDKITRHSGKKSVWSAERLSSLLED